MSRYTGLFKLSPTPGSSEDGFVVHDKEVIKRSIANLINTHKGSRVYDPEYGTNLHRLITEVNLERIRNVAKGEIQSAVEKYEPRGSISRIEAYVQGETNQEVLILMTLLYTEYNDSEIIEFKFASDAQWVDDINDDKDSFMHVEDLVKNNK
jgi:phage baseplate assembly protein W